MRLWMKREMAGLGTCSAALLQLLCSATWLLIRGTAVVEAASALDRGPEVLGRAGRRAGKGSGGSAGVPVGSAAQGQPHPGLIVTVVIVALLGFLSASCIAKRYCFPQSNQTFMYSMLRRYEELNIPDENTQYRQRPDSSGSDQDLQE